MGRTADDRLSERFGSPLPKLEYPRYLMKDGDACRFFSLQEAGEAYRRHPHVTYGDIVLHEDMTVSEMTPLDCQKIVEIAKGRGMIG